MASREADRKRVGSREECVHIRGRSNIILLLGRRGGGGGGGGGCDGHGHRMKCVRK